MKTRSIALACLSLLATTGVSTVAAKAPKPTPYVTLYEHDHAKGKSVTMKPTPKGRFVPLDEIQKYGLQDKVTWVEYVLPKDQVLILFTHRFFGTKGNTFWGRTHQPLYLKGTGSKEIVDLRRVSGPISGVTGGFSIDAKGDSHYSMMPFTGERSYNDAIRSVRIENVPARKK